MNNPLMVFMNGLTYAGLLFMSASGLTLILGLMRIVNMSHGMYYLTGAYAGFAVYTRTGNWFLAIIVGGLAVAAVALFVRLALFPRVMGNDLSVTLLTLGINFVLSDFFLMLYGGRSEIIEPPAFISRSWNLGILQYPGTRLFILIVAIVQGVFMWWLMNRTHMGKCIRAGVDNREMTSALGINIDLVFTFVFILSGFMVGISGVMGGSYMSFTAGTDAGILSYSLVVVIVGGMGSLVGAGIGALMVGMLDSYCKALAPDMTNVVIFGTLMLILAFRPNGFFGKER